MGIMTFIIISAIMTVLNIAGVAWVMFHYLPQQARSFAERQEVWHEIERTCKALISESTVQRCLVLKLTNGGGEPVPGKTYYSTAMVGEVDSVYKHKPIHYEAIQIDNEYIAMVAKARAERRVQLLVETMPYCILRTFYKSEGVQFSEAHYLCSTPDATYFMTFATYDEIHLQPSWGQILRCVNDVRRLLKKAYPNAK